MDLKLIEGTVSDLTVRSGYDNSGYSSIDSNLAGNAAIIAACVGNMASSAVLSSASHSADVPMQFFECLVDGKLLAGRLYQVEFKNSDVIEFAAECTAGGT